MEPLTWLAWIIIGLVAGWLAHLVMGGGGTGLVVDLFVGVIGALIGGFLFVTIGSAGAEGFAVWSLFVAFIGAVVLLGLLRLFTDEPRHRI